MGKDEKGKTKIKEEKPKASATAAAAFLAKKADSKDEKEKTKIKEEKPKASATAAQEKDKLGDASNKGKSRKDTSESNISKTSSSSSIKEKNDMISDIPSSPVIDDATNKEKIPLVDSTTSSTEEQKSEAKTAEKIETSSESIKLEEMVEKVEIKSLEEVKEATITPPPPTSSLEAETKVSILDEDKEVSKVNDTPPTTAAMTTAITTDTDVITPDDNQARIGDTLVQTEIKRRETTMHVPRIGEDLNWAKRQLEEHSNSKNIVARDSV